MTHFDLTKPATVYALADPRLSGMEARRYIGVTQRPLAVRLRQHLGHQSNGGVSGWLNEMAYAGVSPVVISIRDVPAGDEPHDAEVEEIGRHQSACFLLNYMNNPSPDDEPSILARREWAVRFGPHAQILAERAWVEVVWRRWKDTSIWCEVELAQARAALDEAQARVDELCGRAREIALAVRRRRGHASLNTTQGYVGTAEDAVFRMVEDSPMVQALRHHSPADERSET